MNSSSGQTEGRLAPQALERAIFERPDVSLLREAFLLTA
jgi:hypothetical protein